ncbi:MAG: sigma-54 dependent transcriptional regulator [Verrucomicrobiota bacterium]
MGTTSPLTDKHIFIADENADRCQQLRNVLKDRCPDITVCMSPLRALRRLRGDQPDLVLIARGMRELDSREFIRRATAEGRSLNFALIGVGIPGARPPEASIDGCVDFIEFPLSDAELLAKVEHLVAVSVPPPRPVTAGQTLIISEDPAMKAIFDLIELASKRDSRVLILGETGTGKQLVAQAVHEQSPRRNHPFVEVNCAAIPENLLESELFGHERGAFTGATDRRIGRFEQADQGTLFLDEIGELTLPLQSKLLRVLQSGCFSRIGSNTTIRSNTRVVAATNRDLLQEVETGRFRADLYYRLNVIRITLPALRRRSHDIPLLATHFLRKHRAERSFPSGFTEEAMRILQQHRWPGNVRELEHVVERLAVLHDHPLIGASDLPANFVSGTPEPEVLSAPPITQLLQGDFAAVRAGVEKLYFQELIRRVERNLTEAARVAGLPRARLVAQLRRHDIDPTSGVVPAMLQAAAAGDFAKARNLCGEMITWEPNNAIHYYNLGCIEARDGGLRIPYAFDALRRAAELGFDQAQVLAEDADWTEMRQHEDFRELFAIVSRNSKANAEAVKRSLAEAATNENLKSVALPRARTSNIWENTGNLRSTPVGTW